LAGIDLINAPHLDGSYGINTGPRRARRLLLHMAELGLPAATEPLVFGGAPVHR
jgi:3-deoxy-7-phosphoheptulonate synthase